MAYFAFPFLFLFDIVGVCVCMFRKPGLVLSTCRTFVIGRNVGAQRQRIIFFQNVPAVLLDEKDVYGGPRLGLGKHVTNPENHEC